MLAAISPADAHALSMVAVLAFALGSLFTMFFVMARNGQRNRELDLPELPEKTPPKQSPSPPTAPQTPAPPRKSPSAWEKDPDWWK